MTTTGDPVTEQVDGIDHRRVTEWFEEHIGDVRGELRFDLIAGGHSNLSFGVSDDLGRRWVLRRPPLGQVLATAHDMRREHKIIDALGPTEVPVPTVRGLCEDTDVNGAPFYVMDFVDGAVIRSEAQAASFDTAGRRRIGESIVDVLATIHSVDVDAVGLGDLGRKEDYIARQLKRWYTQFQGSDEQVPGGLALPAVHEVHDKLAANIPAQGPAAIVHGDYRLDNCLIAPDGSVAAVLDWEICTLGDPLADVGLLNVYWADPDELAVMPQASPTALDGFARKAELMDRYAAASGRDLSDLDVFVAFGYWKLTCIIAGVYARYAGGAMGDVPEETVRGFRGMLDQLAAQTEIAGARIT